MTGLVKISGFMQKKLFLVTSLVILAMAVACSTGLTEAQKHNNAGVELAKAGRHGEAITEFDEAIKVDPAYVNRGAALFPNKLVYKERHSTVLVLWMAKHMGY